MKTTPAKYDQLTLCLTLAFFTTLVSCNNKEVSKIEIKKFDVRIIDTLLKSSDTFYTEFVGRHDFYTIDHYIQVKDSLVSRVLKDSLGNVVGFNKATKDSMLFSAEYYPNGQMKGDAQIQPYGTGPATYYYPDGRIRSKGQWTDHKMTGEWKNYSEDGSLKEIEYYDSTGKLIRKEEK